MADKDVTTVAPGVTRHECYWGYYLRGTREDLIASGLTKPDWFSDWTERNKRGFVVRSKYFTIDRRQYHVTRPPTGMCSVSVKYQEEEQTAKEAERDHKTPEAFRKDCLDNARFFLNGLYGYLGKSGTKPFRFEDATLDKARECFAELWDVIEQGRVIKVRDPIDPKRMRATAGAQTDAHFRRFMQRAIGDKPAA